MSDLDLRREETEKLKNELTVKLKDLGIATENMDNLLEPDAKSPDEYAEIPGQPVDAEVVAIPFTESHNPNTRDAI